MHFKYQSIYFDNPIQSGRVLDIFMPEKITRSSSIFLIHGGGWQRGSRACYHNIMRALNAEGFICASTDYRMGEGINLWDQLTDLRHSYDIFVGELEKIKRPMEILVHGSSAGAHLASLISFAQPGECGESLEYNGKKISHPWIKPLGVALQAAPIFFEPWEDIFPIIWNSMQKIVGTPYSVNPEIYKKIAPINYLTSKTCPVFHLYAENEHMFPFRHIIEFKERMEKIGGRCECKTYTNAEHGFFYDITRRQQKEAFADIVNFVKSLEEQ